MDAWIDCMTSIDRAEDRMSAVTVASGEILIMKIEHAFEFRQRCPDQYDAIVESSAFVNYRRAHVGETPVLALLLVDQPSEL